MSSITPALLSVLFSVSNPFQATLCIRGHCRESQLITVIRRDENNVKEYTITGNDSLMCLPVHDGEPLILLVEDQASIVASGIYEVDLSLAEELGAVLVPKATANIMIDQCDATVIQNGIEIALDNADAALKAATETAVAQ